MDINATVSGCQCELCHPNWYLGWDGGFTPNQPETFPALKREEEVDEALVTLPSQVRLVMAS